ncbi:hypothetical protein [Leptothoe sp. PORK10 BA2]|uniref:hypothetical protein n=1 Tax=Leptothoe sp. PORK10 BA2 TaxID=3110254 RepID=UPI002B200D81|nr:hypothetical protein [Leptothoe sp. PORK10 BA2]
MAQLAPIQLEDGTTIYIEAEESVTAPATLFLGLIPPSRPNPIQRQNKSWQHIFPR